MFTREVKFHYDLSYWPSRITNSTPRRAYFTQCVVEYNGIYLDNKGWEVIGEGISDGVYLEDLSCLIERKLWLSLFSLPRTALSGIVAATQLHATRNIYIIKSEILTASLSTKNVIVGCNRDHPPCDIGESNIGREDPIRCYARRSAVKVVLLDIYTEGFDIRNLNVRESYVHDAACGIVIGLDP